MTNFDFLLTESKFEAFSQAAVNAEQTLAVWDQKREEHENEADIIHSYDCINSVVADAACFWLADHW